MAYIKHSFKKRGDSNVGEVDTQLYLDAFYLAYNTAYPFDGRTRKAYVFDNATMVEQGGQLNKNVLIGSYELNQKFVSLQNITPPLSGVLKTFRKGSRNIDAILFPIPIANNTMIQGVGGQYTAATLETLLGLQAGDIVNFIDDGTDVSFYIGIDYEIPVGAFTSNTYIRAYLDNDNHVTKVNLNGFFNCPNYTSSVLNGVTVIENSAFDSCAQGTTHSVNAVTDIKATAFYDNELVTGFAFPSLKNMGSRCLSNCIALASLFTPLVEVLKDNVFENCPLLLNVELPSVTSLDPFAFDNWGGNGYTLTVPVALTSDPAVLSTQANGTNVIFI